MPAAAAVGGASAEQRAPSRGLRVAMFGVMTFMLIAVISVIVVTLFAVVFLSRKSQDVVIHRMHPGRPADAMLPFQLPPRHQVQVQERMVRRRRPFMSRQQQKKGHGKRRSAAAVARSRANHLVARIHRRLFRKPFFKRQKHQKRRKAKSKARPSYD
ncbi:hypothetical protein V5799_009381 [Amblyomma americanum]|uniref:Uncharacterized protein n=1 Tax=Amblyomma americanum TaxID=6943 RepID=A0AAQ4FB90_AMBAM